MINECTLMLPVRSWGEYFLPKAILQIISLARVDTVWEMLRGPSKLIIERIIADTSSSLMKRKDSMRLEFSNCKTQTLRKCLQEGPYGAKAMSEKLYDTIREAMVGALLAKSRSWVLRNSLAISPEETTRMRPEPSRRDIRGPYFRENACSALWGCSASQRMFRIMDSRCGPGGSLALFTHNKKLHFATIITSTRPEASKIYNSTLSDCHAMTTLFSKGKINNLLYKRKECYIYNTGLQNHSSNSSKKRNATYNQLSIRINIKILAITPKKFWQLHQKQRPCHRPHLLL